MKDIKIYFVAGFLALSSVLSAQENPDMDFKKAQELAKEQRFSESIALIQPLHLRFPDNADYTVYLASLYFWSGDYDAATELLKKLRAENGSSKEAFDLLLRVQMANKEYHTAIQMAKEGKQKFRETADFYILQEAIALEKTGKYSEARMLLDDLSKTSPYFKDAEYLQTELDKKKKNTIALGHFFTDYDNSPQAYHITHLEYSRRYERFTLAGRINYGQSYTDEIQGEADAYMKLNREGYFYLNAGISGGKIFPQYKVGGEYFHEFKKITASLGARYLAFNEHNKTLLLTGHAGWNIDTWKLEYRHYLSENNSEWLSSGIVNIRKNFEATESYAQLELQYGTLPYFFLNNESLLRLSAYRIGISSKLRIQRNFFIHPVIMYEREEFVPDKFRNRITAQLSLSKRF